MNSKDQNIVDPQSYIKSFYYLFYKSTCGEKKSICGGTFVAKFCPILFNPMDCNLLGSSFHGIS